MKKIILYSIILLAGLKTTVAQSITQNSHIGTWELFKMEENGETIEFDDLSKNVLETLFSDNKTDIECPVMLIEFTNSGELISGEFEYCEVVENIDTYRYKISNDKIKLFYSSDFWASAFFKNEVLILEDVSSENKLYGSTANLVDKTPIVTSFP